MNKSYITPSIEIEELTGIDSMLTVSLSEDEEDVNSFGINTDSEKAGGDQLTKQQSIWDSNW